ncbi:MAG: flagellar hook-basal body complex protein FliE [Kistimonas sp.]|nr:flagellar hook-basal body complex protein FliE [Kistimonas sp.]
MDSSIVLPATLSRLPAGLEDAGSGVVRQEQRQQKDGYAALLQQALSHVDDKNHVATQAMGEVARRESDNLIDTVMRIQDARLTFEFALQVRNRLVEGYHELFNQNT